MQTILEEILDNQELKDFINGQFKSVEKTLDRLEKWVSELNDTIRGDNGLVTRTKMLEEAMYQRRWLYRIVILTLVGLLSSIVTGAILNKAFGSTTVRLGADYEQLLEYRDYRYEAGFNYKGKYVDSNFSHKIKERKYSEVPEANTNDEVTKGGIKYKIKKFNVAASGRRDKRKEDISADATVGYSLFKWCSFNIGYSASWRDDFFSMLVVKADFPINKYLLYQFHCRSDFDERAWEFWTQITARKDLAWGLGIESYIQFDYEREYCEQERGINLTYTFKKGD